MEWLWDKLQAKLPRRCHWVVYNNPVLVHPRTGLLFGFCGGTHTYALRLPDGVRQAAAKARPERVWRYPGGESLDLDTFGPEWIFGAFNTVEAEYTVAAYEAAGKGGTADERG